MITDNTAKWKAVKLTEFAGKSLPVGFMHFSLEKEVPAGELPAYGYLYNRILYADLWAYAQTHNLVISESEWQAIASANDGNCAYYSSGNGSTTFRVPKLPTTIASDVPSEVPVVGNGMSIGLTDGQNKAGLSYSDWDYVRLYVNSGFYGASVGGGVESSSTFKPGVGIGITTDSTKSGIVAKTSATKITGQWLIVAFGVAHNIGEADVANVMQAVEQVQTGLGVVDGIADYIVESYRNGTEWYEVYKSGKIRQGGAISIDGTWGNRTVTFKKSFTNNPVGIWFSLEANENYYNSNNHQYVYSLTKTNAKLGYCSDKSCNLYWIAEG